MRKVASVPLFLVLILNFGCVRTVVLEGTAMSPSFNEGERYLIRTDVNAFKRGDVISFLYPNNQKQSYFKRIIGLPNETIEIKNGVVFVDEKPLDEPYVDATMNEGMTNMPPRKIESDAYFVIGDNRDNSSDSRIWGTVHKDLVQGLIWFQYADGGKK
jgi:signal peptidase I